MILRNPLTILIDYRGAFQSKASNALKFGSLDLGLLTQAFAMYDCIVELRTFPSLDLRKENFRNRWVLLNSSEDHNLLYKSYLEDIALALSLQGAKLVPEFIYLRAHQNKVFSELLRDVLGGETLHNIKSRVFATYEDFLHENLDYPVVFKIADGSGSKGVRLALDSHLGRQVAKRISQSTFPLESLKELVKRIIRKEYIPRSMHRRKFISQTFINNLLGDYKVLIYHNKFYCLARSNRKNDFRASGSGIFSFPTNGINHILNYASDLFKRFDCPLASFDIAYDGNDCYLIEFQFLFFGTYTIENAPHYFIRGSSGWEMVIKKSVVEEEFARSVVEFINMKTEMHDPKELAPIDLVRKDNQFKYPENI